MGIHANFELMAKKVQEFAQNQQQQDEIGDLVFQIESVCNQACKELEVEFNNLKNIKHEK
jgi:NTP pyrophosphatase (non-canonical NTP hydrolase)